MKIKQILLGSIALFLALNIIGCSGPTNGPIDSNKPEIPDFPIPGGGGNTNPEDPFVRKYKITYEIEPSLGFVTDKNEYKEGDSFKLDVPPVREGFEFIGWYNSDNEIIEEIKKTDKSDMVLTPKWNVQKFQITYNWNEGIPPYEFVTEFTFEEMVELPKPRKNGFKFIGWYDNKDLQGTPISYLVPSDSFLGDGVVKMVPKDYELFSKWEELPIPEPDPGLPQYNITYIVDDADLNKVDIYAGDKSTTYTEQDELYLKYIWCIPGYKFVGWHEGSKTGPLINTITKGTTGDKTYYAEIKLVEHTISYINVEGATHSNVTKYEYADKDTLSFTDASRNGYKFMGWYADPKFKKKVTKLSDLGTDFKDFMIYAKWSKYHKVTYIDDLNGNGNNPTEVCEDETIKLKDKIKAGYCFIKWVDSNGNKITELKNITTDITLRAEWSIITYFIKYHVCGGVNNPNNKDSFTVNDAVTLLPPTKDGYEFICWSTISNALWYDEITNIPKGTTEGYELYAIYEHKPFNDMIAVEGSVDKNIDNLLVGKHEVTVKQYTEVMRMSIESEEVLANINKPVYSRNFCEMVEYCNYLSMKEHKTPCYTINDESDPSKWGQKPNWNNLNCNFTANGYRLPTQDEWMYIAKGGKTPEKFTYAGSNDFNEVAWHKYNSNKMAHDVCTKKPNKLGIYDLNGNVAERLWDYDGADSSQRLYIGGSFDDTKSFTSSYTCIENTRTAWLGFRVVCTNK